MKQYTCLIHTLFIHVYGLMNNVVLHTGGHIGFHFGLTACISQATPGSCAYFNPLPRPQSHTHTHTLQTWSVQRCILACMSACKCILRCVWPLHAIIQSHLTQPVSQAHTPPPTISIIISSIFRDVRIAACCRGKTRDRLQPALWAG